MNEPTSLAPHRAVLVLVLGILGLVVCPLLGIAPWVMGRADLQAMREGRMDPEGRGMTQAGQILGIVSVGLGVVCMLAVLGVLVFALVMGAGAH